MPEKQIRLLPGWATEVLDDKPGSEYQLIEDDMPGGGFQVAVVKLGGPGEFGTLVRAGTFNKDGIQIRP